MIWKEERIIQISGNTEDVIIGISLQAILQKSHFCLNTCASDGQIMKLSLPVFYHAILLAIILLATIVRYRYQLCYQLISISIIFNGFVWINVDN
jgi:hypothetical protein